MASEEELDIVDRWNIGPAKNQQWGASYAVAIANVLTIKFNTDFKFETEVSSQELIDNVGSDCINPYIAMKWILEFGIHSNYYYRRFLGWREPPCRITSFIVPRFRISGVVRSLYRQEHGKWGFSEFPKQKRKQYKDHAEWISSHLRDTPLICEVGLDKKQKAEFADLMREPNPNYVLTPPEGAVECILCFTVLECHLSSLNPDERVLRAQSSWGESWNGGGTFFLRLDAVQQVCAPRYFPRDGTITHDPRPRKKKLVKSTKGGDVT